MNRSMCLWMCLAVALTVGAVCRPSFAQQDQPPAKPEGPFRKLAPGVLQTVDPARKLDESFSRHDVIELLRLNPKFDWAKDLTFRHDVWMLQFKFKPVRMIEIDVPQANGYMAKKLIWYMVYSVTNKEIEEKISHVVYNPAEQKFEQDFAAAGGVQGNREVAPDPPKFGWMCPLEAEEGKYQVQFTNNTNNPDKLIRFVPSFLLESPELGKAYADRVVPLAVRPIRRREDPNRQFLTTVQICNHIIKPGETVWGVVTWDFRDPQAELIDRFSIYVQGLTNAYRWKDLAAGAPGAYQPGKLIGTGRTLSRKTLKLNFWRPGDERYENYYDHEREIRYGVPAEVSGGKRVVDYEWVYR